MQTTGYLSLEIGGKERHRQAIHDDDIEGALHDLANQLAPCYGDTIRIIESDLYSVTT